MVKLSDTARTRIYGDLRAEGLTHNQSESCLNIIEFEALQLAGASDIAKAYCDIVRRAVKICKAEEDDELKQSLKLHEHARRAANVNKAMKWAEIAEQNRKIKELTFEINTVDAIIIRLGGNCTAALKQASAELREHREQCERYRDSLLPKTK